MKLKNIVMGLAGAALLWGLPSLAAETGETGITNGTGGIIGPCSDCHTMHNSEENVTVSTSGWAGLPNLLRYSCNGCHARSATGPKIVEFPGGAEVPQVYHGDLSDLAAGNFKHIRDGGSRKGHDVRDFFAGGDKTGGAYDRPPGFPWAYDEHDGIFALSGNPFGRFTCAGVRGCHGARNQREQLPEGTSLPYTDRVGLRAIAGAHHNSQDGRKDPPQNSGVIYGAQVAAGYRFIPGLRGYGNEVDRWQNKDKESHNEYYGAVAANFNDDSCANCHEGGIKVPYQSMTGFCMTCHTYFHSGGGWNGTSGAFLRHPSDYVIPDEGEYAAYLEYSVTAPVARPAAFFTEGMSASPTVTPGTDMVMCLSCHVAHASPYDGMLRFDYAALTSGMRAGVGNSTSAGEGCLACHTAKGGAMPVE